MTILFIVLLHSIPVWLIGARWLDSKMATIIAAIISGAVAVSTGNVAFVFADLLGISVATWLSFCAINAPNSAVAARRLLKNSQRKDALFANERHIRSMLNERFYSETALKTRRSKRRISAVSFCLLLFIALIYLLMSEKIHGFNEFAIALAVGATGAALLWGILNAEWGKSDLELRLQKLRREIETLSK
ncbi:hypothetical protein [Massilia aquatica]|uniref:Uncharacterized protein n=1 Tax=Massilia aquatica TaxID=2609000 RepID=A0ABX0M4M1_9BURK|nr:hypothetical protein [Massilia aquatica]NHZ38569.1 hypothetical protein [Massilia aquatica]